MALFKRKKECAAVDFANRVELELERRHHAKVAACTAQRPKKLRMTGCACVPQLTVGSDNLRRDDAIDGCAILTQEPAKAAKKGIANDTNMRGRAVKWRQAIVLCGRNYCTPAYPSLNSGCSLLRVNGHALHPLGVDHQAALIREAEVMAGRLDADRQLLRPCKVNGSDNILGGCCCDNYVGRRQIG